MFGGKILIFVPHRNIRSLRISFLKETNHVLMIFCIIFRCSSVALGMMLFPANVGVAVRMRVGSLRRRKRRRRVGSVVRIVTVPLLRSGKTVAALRTEALNCQPITKNSMNLDGSRQNVPKRHDGRRVLKLMAPPLFWILVRVCFMSQ